MAQTRSAQIGAGLWHGQWTNVQRLTGRLRTANLCWVKDGRRKMVKLDDERWRSQISSARAADLSVNSTHIQFCRTFFQWKRGLLQDSIGSGKTSQIKRTTPLGRRGCWSCVLRSRTVPKVTSRRYSHMALTFNEIHTISNTEGGVTSTTPTSERLRKNLKKVLRIHHGNIWIVRPSKNHSYLSSSYWWYASPAKCRFFKYFTYIQSNLSWFSQPQEKTAILPPFWRENHQILEITKWRQFDLSHPSSRVSSLIFSPERLLQRFWASISDSSVTTLLFRARSLSSRRHTPIAFEAKAEESPKERCPRFCGSHQQFNVP
jgi:hypothetical protein